MLSRSNSSIVSLDIHLISISIVKHLSPKCQKCKEQEPSRDHKFSILENVAFLRDCTSATLPHFEVALVGAKPLHLACARPGCHSNAPLGRSLLRKRGLVGACLPQTLLGRSTVNWNLSGQSPSILLCKTVLSLKSPTGAFIAPLRCANANLFNKVQEKLAKNKKAPARHKAEESYLLTTKLYCGK